MLSFNHVGRINREVAWICRQAQSFCFSSFFFFCCFGRCCCYSFSVFFFLFLLSSATVCRISSINLYLASRTTCRKGSKCPTSRAVTNPEVHRLPALGAVEGFSSGALRFRSVFFSMARCGGLSRWSMDRSINVTVPLHDSRGRGRGEE